MNRLVENESGPMSYMRTVKYIHIYMNINTATETSIAFNLDFSFSMIVPSNTHTPAHLSNHSLPFCLFFAYTFSSSLKDTCTDTHTHIFLHTR